MRCGPHLRAFKMLSMADQRRVLTANGVYTYPVCHPGSVEPLAKFEACQDDEAEEEAPDWGGDSDVENCASEVSAAASEDERNVVDEMPFDPEPALKRVARKGGWRHLDDAHVALILRSDTYSPESHRSRGLQSSWSALECRDTSPSSSADLVRKALALRGFHRPSWPCLGVNVAALFTAARPWRRG